MSRFCLLLFVMLLPLSCFADDTEEQLKLFLQSREVIAQIYFNPSSTQLTTAAKSQLDSIVPKLKSLSKDTALIRLEGFSYAADSSIGTLNYSMQRSMAVRDFLKEHYDLNVDIYLTGFGAGAKTAGDPEKSRRVDISVYPRPGAAAALFEDMGTVDKIVIK